MPPSDQSNSRVAELGRADGRAQNELRRPNWTNERQEYVCCLLGQVADVYEEGRDGAGARYLHIHGAHGAGFDIAVVVATDGEIGWVLV